ncbi:MAG TPA: peptidase P60 [Caulobacteraceae bacterium]
MRREAIVAAARSWLGTPYQHQASLKGVGCDCLGLVRGVWREVYGDEPEPPPPYRADWAEMGSAQTLLEAAARHLIPIEIEAFRPGDVLLFRMTADACVKHAAIVSAAEPGAKIIHAYWGRACVESWLGPWWRRRLAAAFSFPGMQPPGCPRECGDPSGASVAADSAWVPAFAGMNGI